MFSVAFIRRRVHLLATVQSCAITINTHTHMCAKIKERFLWLPPHTRASRVANQSRTTHTLHYAHTHTLAHPTMQAHYTTCSGHCQAECIINEAIFRVRPRLRRRCRRLATLAHITRMCQRMSFAHARMHTNTHAAGACVHIKWVYFIRTHSYALRGHFAFGIMRTRVYGDEICAPFVGPGLRVEIVSSSNGAYSNRNVSIFGRNIYSNPTLR